MTTEEAKKTICPIFATGTGLVIAIIGSKHPEITKDDNAFRRAESDSFCIADRCAWWTKCFGCK
jgi:hypothetical protein